MTVLELFNQCNRENIPQIMIDNHFLKEYKDVKQIQNEFDSFLKKISNVDIIEIDEENKRDGFVLVVDEVYSPYSIEPIKESHGTYSIPKIDIDKNVSKYFDVFGIHIKELVQKRNILGMTIQELKEKDLYSITKYGIDLMPWGVILNLDILPTSIDIYGVDIIAAKLFYEMTFYGGEEENQRILKDLTQQIDDNINEITSYTNKHKVSYDDATNKLQVGPLKILNSCFKNLENENYFETSKQISDIITNAYFVKEKAFYERYLNEYKDSEFLSRFL